MENYHKYNYNTKPYRKTQYIQRKSFNFHKRKSNSDFYAYEDDYFQKNYKINKDIQKTTFNKLNSTEKNQKEESAKKVKSSNNFDNSNALNDDIISNTQLNENKGNEITKTKNKDNNKDKLYDNELNPKGNKSLNKYKKICLPQSQAKQQQHQIIMHYNLNYNNNISNKSNNINIHNINNMSYYHNYIPFTFSNSINNYYINNNIIIYNNAIKKPNINPNHNPYQNKQPDLPSILSSYANLKNSYLNANQILNPYLIGPNYLNILFSRNEEQDENAKNNNEVLDAKKENTCILEINVKISKNKTYNFILKRFDDLFETVQIFCQINELDTNLYMPIIVNIIKALNSIYGIYNLKLNEKEIQKLILLKYFYCNYEKNNSI